MPNDEWIPGELWRQMQAGDWPIYHHASESRGAQANFVITAEITGEVTTFPFTERRQVPMSVNDMLTQIRRLRTELNTTPMKNRERVAKANDALDLMQRLDRALTVKLPLPDEWQPSDEWDWVQVEHPKRGDMVLFDGRLIKVRNTEDGGSQVDGIMLERDGVTECYRDWFYREGDKWLTRRRKPDPSGGNTEPREPGVFRIGDRVDTHGAYASGPGKVIAEGHDNYAVRPDSYQGFAASPYLVERGYVNYSGRELTLIEDMSAPAGEELPF